MSGSVRVYTVANESRYVVVRNVPTLGVIDDLLKRLSLYGKVCEYQLLDHADDREAALPFEDLSNEDSEFIDSVWVQYETVNNARHAKARGVQKPFYGNKLQITYAPHFESRDDTANKLAQRRQLLQRRARFLPAEKKRSIPWNPPLPPPLPPSDTADDQVVFIGPQLPSGSKSIQQKPQLEIQTATAMKNLPHNSKRRRI
ncbi:rna recognition motif-containing protein [Plasmopara halstedii]|uniref:RNA-binding protein 48 n=1 Tax=Plasmopara halstedii TaxID=4781 RepID=A0A0P1A6A4_PLAHL|nr:rna recognition motif-containing protein [Plasmopara halstedii]CEG36116.1 rna recognition motif-containing protein [Plasmopara halstedii]|eukprot:XP_024572485.1 rna recognition motif-containing protein [Plasmopara halstedii]